MRRKLNLGILVIFLMLWGVCIYSVLTNRDALTLFIEFERDTMPDTIAMVELEKGVFEIAHDMMEFIAHDNEGHMKNVQMGLMDITKIGEEHYRREQLKGPNEAKNAAALSDKIKRWNMSLSRLVSLKQNGASIEALLQLENKTHPLFDALIDQVQIYRNAHMDALASSGSRVFNKHNNIVKTAKIIGIAGTLLALTIVFLLDRLISGYIDDRNQEERRLQRRRDDLSTALDTTGYAVIFTDADGRVYSMNLEAERLVNVEMDEQAPPLLSEVLTIVTSDTKEAIKDPVAQLLDEDGSMVPADRFILTAENGAEHLVTCNGSALFNDDGSARGAVLAFCDVTDEFSGLQSLSENEARLRLVVFNTYQLLYDWDFKTNEFKWFGDIDNALGYKPTSFVKWEELLHPNDRKEVIEAYQRVLFEKNSTFDMKYRIKGKDGTWRTWIDRGGVMLDAANEPYKWVGACTDITEYKWTEKTLRERQYYFRLLIDNLNEDILVVGPDYRITFVNDKLSEKTGLKRGDIIGSRCFKVLYGHDDPCIRHGKACRLHEVFETGKPGRCSHEIKHDDGSVRWKDVLFSPLKDENGKVVRVIETIRDVTDLLTSEEKV